MKLWWEGLKPTERRWAVFIGGVIFLMLNYFFVWPHFGDWKRDEFRLAKAQATNNLYRAELRHQDEYKRKIRELQSDGSEVLPEDQAIDFLRFYNSHALGNGIMTTSQGNLVTHTNDYSLDQQMVVGVQANETNLVNFLYGLSEGNSMMRVRSMTLHPDPSHQQLGANITIVASYQKKMPAHATNAVPAKTVATPTAAPVKIATPADKKVMNTSPPPQPISTSKPGNSSPNRP